jgi:hypothetical protein
MDALPPAPVPSGRLLLSVCLATALGLGAAAVAEPPGPGLTRVLTPTLFPTWQTWNVAHPVVLEEAGRLLLYYSGSGDAQMNDSVTDVWAIGLATSEDQRHFSYPEDYEPVLIPRRFREGEVVDPKGTRGAFDRLAVFAPTVLRDASGYRMWYTGWNGAAEIGPGGRTVRLGFRIGLTTSTDGRHWMKIRGVEPDGAAFPLGGTIAPDGKGASHPWVLRQERGLRMWYEAFDGQASRIATAWSSDGSAWRKEGVALDLGRPEADDELGLSHPVVFARQGHFELWYEATGRGTPAHRILRAVSPDGLRWTRAGEVPLNPVPPVTGDERIHVGSVLVQRDGSCRVFLARQLTTRRQAAWGEVTNRSFQIFVETINP